MPRWSAPLRTLAVTLSLLLAAPALAAAETPHLTEEQIREIEYHYKLDQYLVTGCIFGAAVGAATGIMRISGLSVAVAPYISTGCSLGFLIVPAGMMVRDFFRGLVPEHQSGKESR